MTIAEIAEKAGVSKSAVSRYLNNGYISEKKRSVIQKVIEETGYIPSTQAQTLRTGKSRMIGVIVPRIDSDSISRIIAGISEVLEENNYRLLLANTQNRPEKELEYLDVFKNGNVDAVIFIATILTNAHKRAIKNCNVPIVLLGQQMNDVSCIYNDDFGAAYELTNLLIKHNRDKLGYIGVTNKDKAAGLERFSGFKKAYNITDDYIEISDFTLDGGYNAAKRLLNRKSEINGLFCATDTIAIGVMKFLKERSFKIPKDIAVVSIGDSKFSQIVSPQLTTAKYYYSDSGKQAAKHILNMINKQDNHMIQVKFGFELCIRETI